MNLRHCALLFAGFFAGLPTLPAALSVVVLPWESHTGEEDVARDFAALLEFFLLNEADINMVDRSRLDAVIDELALGAGGIMDSDTAARIGSLVGAQVILSGRLIQAGERTIAMSRIMGVETLRVFAERTGFQNAGEMEEAAETLASLVKTRIQAERSQLLANGPDSQADPLEDLRSLSGSMSSLPRVSVVVPEFHIGRVVPDPAGETEIIRILTDLGFTVLDPSSGQTVEYEISGEAFSEGGLQVRGLVSCRARVEVKVVNKETGQIIFSDASHTTAVDTAEHVAGKAALQKGGHAMGIEIARALLTLPSSQ